jgi:hypothetical protein
MGVLTGYLGDGQCCGLPFPRSFGGLAQDYACNIDAARNREFSGDAEYEPGFGSRSPRSSREQHLAIVRALHEFVRPPKPPCGLLRSRRGQR